MNKQTKRYIDKIRKKAGRAINEYGLINEGDRVAVAVSGGIDSLVLLEILVTRRAYLPIHYDVFAVHVVMRNAPYAIDLDALKAFCDRNNVTLFLPEIELTQRNAHEALCVSCAFLRRKALFDWMKKHECGRLAFGHHMDDAIETLFLNMVFEANFSTMPAKLPLFRGEFDIIRPLMYLTGDEIRTYASLAGIEPCAQPCTHGSHTNRHRVRALMKEFEKINPLAKHNIFAAMENIRAEYLPRKGNQRNADSE